MNSRNVKVAQKPFQTERYSFAKPKDPVTQEQRTDAIKSIPCNYRDHEYIGQTKRQFSTRLKERQKAVLFCGKEIQEYMVGCETCCTYLFYISFLKFVLL